MVLLDDEEQRLTLARAMEGSPNRGGPASPGPSSPGSPPAGAPEPPQTLAESPGSPERPRPWSGRTSAEGSSGRAPRLMRMLTWEREMAAAVRSGTSIDRSAAHAAR